jgi:hypothetical protein
MCDFREGKHGPHNVIPGHAMSERPRLYHGGQVGLRYHQSEF